MMIYSNARQHHKNIKKTATGKPVAIKQANSVKTILQTKLKIGQPGDKYEQEADRVADQVMLSPVQKQQQQPCSSCTKQNPIISQLQTKPRSSLKNNHSVIPASVQQVIQSSGKPIDSQTRAFFKPRLAHDFSRVRLHTDAKAAQSATDVNARAYTVGNHISFANGLYNPASSQGKKLLAHELVHVMQQSQNTVQRDYAVPSVNNFDPVISNLTPAEIRAAINFNRIRYYDRGELRLLRDVLGLSRTPTVIDSDFVQAVANYQHEFGLSGVDGKLGTDSAAALTRELRAEGETNAGTEMSIRNRADETKNNINSGTQTGAFDARLSHKKARLSLNMRVKFNFSGAWPSNARKRTWSRDFERRVESRWSWKLLMKRQQRRHRKYLRYYGTKVNVFNSNTNPHYQINVRWATSFMGSSVNVGSNVATLDALDTNTRNFNNTFGGVTRRTTQRPVEHEFGHMMGLPHIECNSNNANCYGTSHGRNNAGNVMGMGSSVTPSNAAPFQTAIKGITSLNWDAISFRMLV
ncbi:MAG: DUF4157 domain-containing protein [Gammaproteobacteria bacterium]|nr:DUF4157 domain-containing protein [Gammaproteobacteria bacterium]MBT7044657.1 DUF4157 domain-containing protein [Gammaproteobacteria bacterium]